MASAIDTSIESIPHLPDDIETDPKTNTTMETEAPSDDDDSGTTNPIDPTASSNTIVTLPSLPEDKRGYGGKNATGCTDEECFVFASAFVNFFNVLKRKQIMEVPVSAEDLEDGIYTDDESRNMSVISLDVTTDGAEEEDEDGIVNIGGDVLSDESEEMGQVVTSGSMKSVVSPSSSADESVVETVTVNEGVEAGQVVTPATTVESVSREIVSSDSNTAESVSREIVTSDSNTSSSITSNAKKERNFQWGKKSIKKLREKRQSRKDRKKSDSNKIGVTFSEDAVGATPDAADVESDAPITTDDGTVDTAAADEKQKKKRTSWKKRFSSLKRKNTKKNSIAE